MSIRLDARLKSALAEAAAEDHRTITSLMEKVLSDWAKAAGYLKAPKG